jgi:hypothetical protein
MKTFDGTIADIIRFFEEDGSFADTLSHHPKTGGRKRFEIEPSLIGKPNQDQAEIRFNFRNKRGYREKWSLCISFGSLGDNRLVAIHKTKFHPGMLAWTIISVGLLSSILVSSLLYYFRPIYLPANGMFLLILAVTIILVEWEILYCRRKATGQLEKI